MFLRSVLLTLLVLAAEYTATAAIFGSDDRHAVAPGSKLAKLIGSAHYGMKRTTVFLTGSCLAVTSQHLISKNRSTLGTRVRLSVGARNVGAEVVAEGGLHRRTSAYDLSGDWVLLRLDYCTPELAEGLKLSRFEKPAVNLALSSAGLPGDLKGLSIDPACRIRDSYREALFHDCATFPGSSGSPIFQIETSTGRAQVYAIQAAGHRVNKPEPYQPSRANLATAVWPIIDAMEQFLMSAPPSAAGAL